MKKISVITLFLFLLLAVPPSNTLLNQTQSTFYTLPMDPVLVIGSYGSDSGEFDEPDSVYVDASGNLYAGDTKNFRVQVFDENGTYLYSMGGFSNKTISIGNEVQGITELSNGSIVVIEKASNLYFFNKGENQPYANVSLPAPSGSETTRDTQGIAIDQRNDTIFVSDQPNNKVLVFDANGVFLREFSTGAFTTPENMVVDTSQDVIYVSLEGQRAIGKFDLNGTLITSFGSDYATFNYEGLALDPFGNLLAVDEGPDDVTSKYSRIIMFNKTTLEPFAAIGSYAGTTEGKFLSPDGIAFDYKNNRIYIADQGNYRIQAFDYFSPVLIWNPTVTSLTTEELGSTAFKFYIGGAIFGGTYTLYMDGMVTMEGSFMYGQPIIPDLTGMGVGDYNFTLLVRDTQNNTATSSVKLTIIQTTTSSTTNTNTTNTSLIQTSESSTPISTSESQNNPSVLFSSITTVLIVTTVIIRKRK